MQIKLFLKSASELKNVNRRCGSLQPYAIAWIDSSAKFSTKVDVNNGDNPVWNEKFTIQLPPTSHAETAILYIDIVHAKHAADTKPPLVGSAKLPIRMALNEVRSKGKAFFSLVLQRPSGRLHGKS
ncbi:hypothetical protein LUZ61_012468 [Rhynchospora tenuis]|uniref:C2 domain-containing protein n=1 Tax=Rhynchospora tenuis TaxID=198213 RepID=A0AAD6F1J3_9POAL|nr:hypothetical protein LUZ61_012468 [Rhynchospora tenuis]